MQANLVLILLACCRGTAMGAKETLTDKELAHAPTFGVVDTLSINPLEAFALTTVCLYCDQTEDWGIVPGGPCSAFPIMDDSDRARRAIRYMLRPSGSPLAPVKQLTSEAGFAVWWLLRKLTAPQYIESLKQGPDAFLNKEARRNFDRVVEANEAALQMIHGYLCSEVQRQLALDFQEYMALSKKMHSSLNYAIYAIVKQEVGNVRLASYFKQLLSVWLDAPACLGEAMFRAREFIRIIIASRALTDTDRLLVKSMTIAYVHTKTGLLYIELIAALGTRSQTACLVSTHLTKCGYRGVKAYFIISYIGLLKSIRESTRAIVERVWESFLPTDTTFHTVETDWNTLPVCFNLIPSRFLCFYFKQLHDRKLGEEMTRDIMQKYMHMLDRGVFAEIIASTHLTTDQRHGLFEFMLNHLDEDTRQALIDEAARADDNASTDSSYNLFYRLLRRIERPPTTGNPCLSQASQCPANA
ncbi:hypothetical protein PAPHI01_0010 [Pancytospora philotis]|nr:hypothetical protein PAPHI01_0010 [Pancytospora philotis]